MVRKNQLLIGVCCCGFLKHHRQTLCHIQNIPQHPNIFCNKKLIQTSLTSCNVHGMIHSFNYNLHSLFLAIILYARIGCHPCKIHHFQLQNSNLLKYSKLWTLIKVYSRDQRSNFARKQWPRSGPLCKDSCFAWSRRPVSCHFIGDSVTQSQSSLWFHSLPFLSSKYVTDVLVLLFRDPAAGCLDHC